MSVWRSFANKSYQQNSAIFFLFFSAWSIWYVFFQIWLTDPSGLNLSGSRVGTIFSLNSLATLSLMLAYGIIQDRIGMKRHLALFATILASLVGPFFIWVYRPLLQANFLVGAIIGALFLAAGFNSAGALFETISERYSRYYNFEYGQSRMWGSVGYAVLAIVGGVLYPFDPRLNFWVSSAFGLATLLIQVFWKNPPLPKGGAQPTESAHPSSRDILRCFKKKSLWAIMAFVMLTWTFYTVLDAQLYPDFYTTLFADKEVGRRVFGIVCAGQTFVEAATLGVVPWVMRKIGVRSTILIGALLLFVRYAAYAMFTSVVVITCFRLLWAIELPFLLLPIFRYITLHFPTRLSATLYMVGFQIAAQLGVVIYSPFIGIIKDRIGYQPTFGIVVGAVAVGVGFGALFLLRDNEKVEGVEFYRDSDLSELVDKVLRSSAAGGGGRKLRYRAKRASAITQKSKAQASNMRRLRTFGIRRLIPSNSLRKVRTLPSRMSPGRVIKKMGAPKGGASESSSGHIDGGGIYQNGITSVESSKNAIVANVNAGANPGGTSKGNANPSAAKRKWPSSNQNQ
ncbi:MAG: oligosaccharide MFS transporter [Actinomycetaceae bacterium]|nr:oligosaccharide MFS transporter [Actinomycetaceae bacterium]